PRAIRNATRESHRFAFNPISTRRRRWRSRSRIGSRRRRCLRALIRFCNLTFSPSAPSSAAGGLAAALAPAHVSALAGAKDGAGRSAPLHAIHVLFYVHAIRPRIKITGRTGASVSLLI